VYVGLFDPPRRSGPELLRAVGTEAPEATLYFADPRWTKLVAEARRLQLPAEGAGRIRALVAALADGPREAGAPILPQGAKLRGAYLGPGGLAAVDLEAEAVAEGAGGTSGELLLVYALVHTVVENVPGVQGVQILVDGQERETLAGHVKISGVLRPEPELLGAKE
jgi:hypothetical protein